MFICLPFLSLATSIPSIRAEVRAPAAGSYAPVVPRKFRLEQLCGARLQGYSSFRAVFWWGDGWRRRRRVRRLQMQEVHLRCVLPKLGSNVQADVVEQRCICAARCRCVSPAFPLLPQHVQHRIDAGLRSAEAWLVCHPAQNAAHAKRRCGVLSSSHLMRAPAVHTGQVPRVPLLHCLVVALVVPGGWGLQARRWRGSVVCFTCTLCQHYARGKSRISCWDSHIDSCRR